MKNFFPANPFFYCLLVRQEQLAKLNRPLHPRTQESIKQRFYDIAKSRCRIQKIYPKTMLKHSMNPYQYILPRGKLDLQKKITQIYLYRKSYNKNEWITLKRFFGFQKTKYYFSLKEYGFCLVDFR